MPVKPVHNDLLIRLKHTFELILQFHTTQDLKKIGLLYYLQHRYPFVHEIVNSERVSSPALLSSYAQHTNRVTVNKSPAHGDCYDSVTLKSPCGPELDGSRRRRQKEKRGQDLLQRG